MKPDFKNLDVKYVKGVGPKIAQKLSKIGIMSVRDLLFHFPIRYEDRRKVSMISDLSAGKDALIKARALHITASKSWRRKMHIIRAVLSDNTGSVYGLWFNQPFIEDMLKKGGELFFYGKVVLDKGHLQMVSAEVEDVRPGISLNVGRIVPVYSLGSLHGKGITQRKMRQIVFNALEKAKDMRDDFIQWARPHLPKNFLSRYSSFYNMHFPSDYKAYELARKRFIFEEFFLFSLFLEEKRRIYLKEKQRVYNPSSELLSSFKARLPFEFTDGQKSAIRDMSKDMFSPYPMHRLLQGDVGSGKTIVAFYLSAVVLGSGFKAVFMVPSELLALQHYKKAKEMFCGLCEVVLLTGGVKGRQREQALEMLVSDKPVLAIGTHALIQEAVKIKQLGFVIVDEQHRFGVKQRVSLLEKANMPDVLVMTATPIPRSLAMTLYGDLDVAVIKDLPPGRKPIDTLWIKSDKRDRLYKFIRERVREGEQVYMVYPLVSESDEMNLSAAEQMYDSLKKQVFPDLRIGLVHGKMKPKEKDMIMRMFYDREIDILVATVVIEVGIDVPNASVIVIEHAERFGLSQLHQLRGRIGRGSLKSYCVVVSDSSSENTKKRLSAFVKYTDGFRLSEIDLVLRGPGEFSGEKQHGPTEFKVGNPITDFRILQFAKHQACEAYKQGIRFEKFNMSF